MERKVKILMVCHGNICRSPMAEFILKDMVNNLGLSDQFEIASAATSAEEIWNGIGNPVYPPARTELAKHGINCEGKRAVQMKASDKKGDKIYKLLEFAGLEADCRDPWYTSRFDETYRDVVTGCTAFLECLQKEGKIC